MSADPQTVLDYFVAEENGFALLYDALAQKQPEDRESWSGLADGERHHVRLPETNRDYIVDSPLLADWIKNVDLAGLIRVTEEMGRWVASVAMRSMTSTEALEAAAGFEHAAGELHYAGILSKRSDDIGVKVFQQLNRTGQRHAELMRKRIAAAG